MVVVLKGDEPESLQHAVRHSLRGAENFRHPVNRPRLRLKGNFDKVALRQRLRHLQQAAGHGNGLEFSFGAPAIFERIAARTESPSWTRAARREGCGWGKWVIS